MGVLTMARGGGGGRKNTKQKRVNEHAQCLKIKQFDEGVIFRRESTTSLPDAGSAPEPARRWERGCSLRPSPPQAGPAKSYFHSLLCCDLHDLFHRSSGLVSRPLADLSLSPCIRGRRACRPITPLLHPQRVGEPAPRRKRMLIFITLQKPETRFVLC